MSLGFTEEETDAQTEDHEGHVGTEGQKPAPGLAVAPTCLCPAGSPASPEADKGEG